MSVAEFTLASVIALPLLFTGHELCRILMIRHSTQLVLEAAVSRASLGSLEHIARSTFAPSNRENEWDRNTTESIRLLFQSPLINWSFFTHRPSGASSSLSGIRTTSVGPTRAKPSKAVHGKTNLCVHSWLEPLVQFVSPERNCIGQFKSNSTSSGAPTDGIALHLEAHREIPLTVEVFLNGSGMRKE